MAAPRDAVELVAGPHNFAGHRSDARGQIADKDCDECNPLFFIFGSQVVDEPIAEFDASVKARRARFEERKRAVRLRDAEPLLNEEIK